MDDVFYIVKVIILCKGGSSVATITVLEESPDPILLLIRYMQREVHLEPIPKLNPPTFISFVRLHRW